MNVQILGANTITRVGTHLQMVFLLSKAADEHIQYSAVVDEAWMQLYTADMLPVRVLVMYMYLRWYSINYHTTT